MPNDTLSIAPTTTVAETIRLHPGTLRVFHERGIEACCGGPAPIATAAERHGVDVDELMEALRAAARDG